MKRSHTDLLIDLLNADELLIARDLLGGPYVYRAEHPEPPRIPSVTTKPENDTGRPLVGQKRSGLRDHNAIQIFNIWTDESPQHGDDIEMRLDEILMDTPIPGSWDWQKLSHSQMPDPDVPAWHTVFRYGYTYRIKDPR